MTTTTGLLGHLPCAAYGQTNLHTGELSGSAGSATLTIDDNSTNTIEVGDLVFVCHWNDTAYQFLGKCLTSAATAPGIITTQYRSQEWRGGENKGDVWSPTQAVTFDYQLAEQSPRATFDPGVTLALTRGTTAYSCQFRDATRSWEFAFNPAKASNFEDWLTFLETYRSNGADDFTFAFWHPHKEISCCMQARLAVGPQTLTRINRVLYSFTISLFEIDIDNYVLT